MFKTLTVAAVAAALTVLTPATASADRTIQSTTYDRPTDCHVQVRHHGYVAVDVCREKVAGKTDAWGKWHVTHRVKSTSRTDCRLRATEDKSYRKITDWFKPVGLPPPAGWPVNKRFKLRSSYIYETCYRGARKPYMQPLQTVSAYSVEQRLRCAIRAYGGLRRITWDFFARDGFGEVVDSSKYPLYCYQGYYGHSDWRDINPHHKRLYKRHPFGYPKWEAWLQPDMAFHPDPRHIEHGRRITYTGG